MENEYSTVWIELQVLTNHFNNLIPLWNHLHTFLTLIYLTYCLQNTIFSSEYGLNCTNNSKVPNFFTRVLSFLKSFQNIPFDKQCCCHTISKLIIDMFIIDQQQQGDSCKSFDRYLSILMIIIILDSSLLQLTCKSGLLELFCVVSNKSISYL